MNAVEIEEAISALAEQPFDAQEFPFAFLEAFGNKATTIKKLRSGASNKSDIGGVLQTNNVHIATCAKGDVTKTLAALKASSATQKAKAKFVLATDGDMFEAEDLTSDDPPIACAYCDFPDHFGFFLTLAGITTVKQIRESSFDIRATGRLNKLYVELLKDNADWGTAERRHDMNHFMARLIFCFFAEDTDIFNGTSLFTATVEQMSERDASNTHEVIREIFRAMNIKVQDRTASKLRSWANIFPYVNGELFSGSIDVPRFSKIARVYLLNIGNLDWKRINPDIFGSMIQAVAEDEERGALGMHYTSVPNILKVLNPLFLDDLRARLEEGGNNTRTLLNLRKRMARIRVFDPACGSGNFLVIAYKEMCRFCLWIDDDMLALALSEPNVADRIEAVRSTRLASRDKSLNKLAKRSHQYRDRNVAEENLILVPTVSSEQRDYIPADLKGAECVTTNQAFALYDAPIWNFSLIVSRLHLVWIATVCGKLETRYRYSNTLGWNTFPVPALTEQNKADLSRCAEDILLAREAHFPATIADLYDPEAMPDDLRAAHLRNDETLERIYIGRRFKNDTERLEKLFDLYTKICAAAEPAKNAKKRNAGADV